MLQGADGERLKRAIKAEKDEKERLKEKDTKHRKSWRPRPYGESRPDFKRSHGGTGRFSSWETRSSLNHH